MILRGGVELEYALALTKQNMLKYYQNHGLTWSDTMFRDNWEKTFNWGIHYLPAGKTIGFFRTTWNKDSKTLYLNDLQIEEAYQNQGIGSRFLQQLIDYDCKGLFRCKALKLRVFEDSPAVALYQHFGFVEVSRNKGLIAMMLAF